MELALLVWFAGISGGISASFTFFGFAASAVSIVGYTMWYFSHISGQSPPPPKKRFALSFIVFCLGVWMMGLLIPNQKTVYMMAGAYVSQKMVQSETADKVVKIVNRKLDDYLEEVEKKAGK